ncbi:hypothetical protein LIS44_06485 [Acinetobacter haemolyticus]|nr:hypothetical protein LIS44_06485 [Acinetobacter haemolyticus]
MSAVRWLSKDLWIIAAGFVAAMHVGKLATRGSCTPSRVRHQLGTSQFFIISGTGCRYVHGTRAG